MKPRSVEPYTWRTSSRSRTRSPSRNHSRLADVRTKTSEQPAAGKIGVAIYVALQVFDLARFVLGIARREGVLAGHADFDAEGLSISDTPSHFLALVRQWRREQEFAARGVEAPAPSA